MRRWIVVALGLAIGVPWQLACAWNGEGHRLVAAWAAGMLSVDSRAEIEALYGQPVDQVLPLLSTWADAIVTARPETRPWHYVNIPLRADGFDRLRDCPLGGLRRRCIGHAVGSMARSFRIAKLATRSAAISRALGGGSAPAAALRRWRRSRWE
ncbi:MAG: hypothetical protein FJY37_03065 [Betaproteobacteria bacterium]|nr:hypothetical protein [Betaproteobacteria bacterium]